MRQGSRSLRSAGWSALLGVLTTTLGGPALPAVAQTFAPSRTASTILAPRVTVAWSLQVPPGAPATLIRSGEAIIGPNSTLEIGPYGIVRVGGLTTTQAERIIEQHLGKFIVRPHVHLVVLGVGLAPTVNRAAAPDNPVVPVAAQFPEPDPTTPPTTDAPSPTIEPADLSTPPLLVPPVAPPQTSAVPPSPAYCATEWRRVERLPDPRHDVAPVDRWRSPVHLGAPQVSNVQQANFQMPNAQPMPEPPEQLTQPRPLPANPAEAVPPDAATVPDGPAAPGIPYHNPPVPRECDYHALPSYIVEPPDILVIQNFATGKPFDVNRISGAHLVRPDGTVSLGVWGDIKVAGMTLEQVKMAVYAFLISGSPRAVKPDALKPEDIWVDVLAYNSKYYYVITDGGGYGEQVQRFPITGKETVLDAISQIQGLPPVASKCRIWVARTPCAPYGNGKDQQLPVDWHGITRAGDVHTNYQLMPGDRVYVDSQCIIRIDSTLAKIISPIERLFGITLLGATTVNTIKNRSGTGNGG